MSNVHRLRELLGIEADQAKIREQADRVAQKQRRLPDVAEVLPDAIRQRTNDDDMADALRAPVERALRESVTENPHDLVEILFPVMGPAIRRAISEALRSALEGLNQGLAAGLSARNFRWRLQSWRTGVPYREVVLRHTLRYRVTEALLIAKHSGLLITHVGEKTDSNAMDRDAVAAMLTAVQDFVADSTGDSDGELSSAELGGQVLWVLTGPHARLALVLDGQPPLSLRIGLRDHLAGMHRDHGTFLGGYAGDSAPPPELISKMQQVVKSKEAAAETAAPALSGAAKAVMALLLLAALGAALGLALQGYQQRQNWQKLETLARSQPGVVWVNSQRDHQPAVVYLLADPLVDDVDVLVQRAGFTDQQVMLSITPFVSAEPIMQVRRLKAALQPIPSTVAMELVGDTLRVSGQTQRGWHRRLAAQLEFSGLHIDVDTSDLEVLASTPPD